MKPSYPFLSSSRTFSWQRSRQVNEAPVLLNGTMVRRRPSHEDTWSGLSLSSTACHTAATPSPRASRLWDEFTNGRRTVDPGFNEKEISPPKQAVNSRSRESSAEIGFRTKSVIRDGKAVRSNTSSAENILESSRKESYKGLELFKGRESPVRRAKITSPIFERLSVSQISTLPGGHREEDSFSRKRQPSKKNVSQITTLPGGGAKPPPERDTYSPEKCIMRNIESSVVVEMQVGAPVTRLSPLRTTTPSRKDLATYKTLGREVYEDRRTKGFVSYQSNQQSTAEVPFIKSLKAKPPVAKDLFAPTFRMF